jgi:hypothetical protein
VERGFFGVLSVVYSWWGSYPQNGVIAVNEEAKNWPPCSTHRTGCYGEVRDAPSLPFLILAFLVSPYAQLRSKKLDYSFQRGVFISTYKHNRRLPTYLPTYLVRWFFSLRWLGISC